MNPELDGKCLVNGSTFLTAFYKLSRIHEKILLGLPVNENINSKEILQINTNFEPAKIFPVTSNRPKTGSKTELRVNTTDESNNQNVRNHDSLPVTEQSVGSLMSPIKTSKKSVIRAESGSAKLPNLKETVFNKVFSIFLKNIIAARV